MLCRSQTGEAKILSGGFSGWCIRADTVPTPKSTEPTSVEEPFCFLALCFFFLSLGSGVAGAEAGVFKVAAREGAADVEAPGTDAPAGAEEGEADPDASACWTAECAEDLGAGGLFSPTGHLLDEEPASAMSGGRREASVKAV